MTHTIGNVYECKVELLLCRAKMSILYEAATSQLRSEYQCAQKFFLHYVQ